MTGLPSALTISLMPATVRRRTPFPAHLRRLERAIRGICRDPGLLAELGRRGINGWGNGGCLILAEAVRKTLGGEAKLVGLREGRSHRTEHVAVAMTGWFIDGYGIRDRSDFLYDAETIGDYHHPNLVPFALADAGRHQIPYERHEDLVSLLADRLSAALRTDGSPILPVRPAAGQPIASGRLPGRPGGAAEASPRMPRS